MHLSILLTGVAGFIGFHLAETLLQQGLTVYGLDNLLPNYALNHKQAHLKQLHTYPAFSFISGDILRPQDWPSLPAIQQVVHLAGRVGVRDSLAAPDSYWQTNSLGTLRLLEWCRQRQIQTVLLASSSSVYGNHPLRPWREDLTDITPLSPYAASKRSAELLLQTYSQIYGIKSAILRLFSVYGPWMRPDLAICRFAQALQSQSPLTLHGDGHSERDYTYISDIVCGMTQALSWLIQQPEGTCETFNLGAQCPIALGQMVAILADLLQAQPQLLYQAAHPVEAVATYADIEKARCLLGYEPQVPIAAGLAQFVSWYQGENQRLK